jgi:galactose mutarotase-like enzyme
LLLKRTLSASREPGLSYSAPKGEPSFPSTFKSRPVQHVLSKLNAMSSTSLQHHMIDGFAAITLRNSAVTVTLVPALGARIVSLRSVAGTQEWLWRPMDGRGLFACAENTSFEDSPLVGIDECLPSVLPCIMDGRSISDHGEVWNQAWQCEIETRVSHAITTTVALRSLPLIFVRRLSLAGNTIRLDYTLTNTSSRSLCYLWAMHPLFVLEQNDEIELDGESEVAVTATQGSMLASSDIGPWPSPRPGVRFDRAELGFLTERQKGNSYCKAFLSTARASSIALINRKRGERLTLTVDPKELSTWGYWVSRGAWHGHTHIALEPSNAAANSLAALTPGPSAHTLTPKEVRSWTVIVKLDSI